MWLVDTGCHGGVSQHQHCTRSPGKAGLQGGHPSDGRRAGDQAGARGKGQRRGGGGGGGCGGWCDHGQVNDVTPYDTFRKAEADHFALERELLRRRRCDEVYRSESVVVQRGGSGGRKNRNPKKI